MRSIRAMMMAAALTVMGCGSGNGTGSVTVSVWGEEFIREMIPPATATSAGFENGWTMRYTKFLVNVGNVRLATGASVVGGTIAGFKVYDLHTIAGPTVIGSFASVEAVRYDDVSYSIAPTDATSTAGNATAADLALMQTNRYGIYVEGTASKTGVPDVRIRWGFTNRTDFTACHDASNQAGIAVPTSGTAPLQITIHGDHLYYDDLENPEARTRFDAIAAADRDGDHEVTLDELAMVQLTSLPMMQYGSGPVPNIRTLRDFITYLSSTVGHFNGEGHCQERRR
jgi:hypothetical protein